VLSAFRQELWKRGILLLPDEKELVEKDVASMGGPVLRQVTIKTEYEFRDCRGSEPSIVKSAYGVGMDHGDKAAYKAKTGSVKYLFKILGMIPWIESDDPEADASLDDKTDPRVFDASDNAKTKKQKRISDRQVRAFDSACHQSGKTADQVAVYLRTKFSTATVADLPKEEFNDAIKWACQSSDLKQQIQESVVAANAKEERQSCSTGSATSTSRGGRLIFVSSGGDSDPRVQLVGV